MDSVKVKIKGSVVTSKYGSLSDGDIVSTDAEYARHLVEDCKAGEYVDVAVDMAAPGADRTVDASSSRQARSVDFNSTDDKIPTLDEQPAAPGGKKEQKRNG